MYICVFTYICMYIYLHIYVCIHMYVLYVKFLTQWVNVYICVENVYTYIHVYIMCTTWPVYIYMYTYKVWIYTSKPHFELEIDLFKTKRRRVGNEKLCGGSRESEREREREREAGEWRGKTKEMKKEEWERKTGKKKRDCNDAEERDLHCSSREAECTKSFSCIQRGKRERERETEKASVCVWESVNVSDTKLGDREGERARKWQTCANSFISDILVCDMTYS